jgi:hypothetical protein
MKNPCGAILAIAFAAVGLVGGGAPARANVITLDVSGTMTPSAECRVLSDMHARRRHRDR